MQEGTAPVEVDFGLDCFLWSKNVDLRANFGTTLGSLWGHFKATSIPQRAHFANIQIRYIIFTEM